MNAKEAQKIPHMVKSKGDKWKYQRRVPRLAQDIIGKKMWDLSLGAHYGAAVDKARAYTAEHDALLERLTTPEDRAAQAERNQEEVAAMAVRLRPGMQRRISDDGTLVEVPQFDRNPGLWEQTRDKLKAVRFLPPDQELQALAYFSAYAFGDRSTLDLLSKDSPLGEALTEIMRPQRPDDPVDGPMYDAMKVTLDARIQEVGGKMLVNPKHTLSHIHGTIAKLRNLQPNTIKNHATTTAKFKKFLNDEKGMDFEPSLAGVTVELLQEYLEYLLEDPNVGNGSIQKYFDGMNSVFRHAIKTKKIPGLIVNPVDFIEMPKAKSIEDTMYLPFDRNEIKRVWEEVQVEWGPDNHKSQMSAGRREAFLMAFRVLLWTGLRPMEFFWLRDHGSVTPEYINVQRTKTHIKRKIPISVHIQDFPKFVENGGFEDCIYNGNHKGERYIEYNASRLRETMRESFKKIRERAGITDPRKVLYSTKDTLLQRLRSVKGYNTYMEACVSGHVKLLEKGRHYGGPLGEDEGARAMVKRGLDQITYW